MTLDVVNNIGLVLFSGIALCIVFFDLRQMRIPDILSVALFCLFAGMCIAEVPSDILGRIALSIAVFMLSFIAFARRMMGGGDVKIMTVLALFVPLAALPEIALLFSATLLTGIALVVLARRYVQPRADWAFLGTRRMPMGVCIGLGALIAPIVVA